MNTSSPKYLQLYPTFRCNQRCSFCFNDAMPMADSLQDMSYGDALRLLSICAAHGVPEIDIMGGEPFLLQWMPDFLREATGRGLRINISTNGSLTGIVGRLTGLDPRLLTIGVSLEGSTQKLHNELTCSGHFDDVLRFLSHLLDAGLDPLVKTVVSRKTMPDIPGIVSLITGLGIRRYFLIHMDVLSGAPDKLELCLSYPGFLDFFGKMRNAFPDVEMYKVAASCFDRGALPGGARCAGGVLKLAVAPDGSSYPCNLFLGVDELYLGNVLKEGLEAVWSDKRLEFFRKSGDNTCPRLSCHNRNDCTGGCPAHGYYHFGAAAAPDVRCNVV